MYEAVSSLLHTVLFHRTLGKVSRRPHASRVTLRPAFQFNYTHDSSYSIGTLGFEEISCDFIDFTYVSGRPLLESG